MDRVSGLECTTESVLESHGTRARVRWNCPKSKSDILETYHFTSLESETHISGTVRWGVGRRPRQSAQGRQRAGPRDRLRRASLRGVCARELHTFVRLAPRLLISSREICITTRAPRRLVLLVLVLLPFASVRALSLSLSLSMVRQVFSSSFLKPTRGQHVRSLPKKDISDAEFLLSLDPPVEYICVSFVQKGARPASRTPDGNRVGSFRLAFFTVETVVET